MKIAFLTLGCKLNYAETSTYERGFVSAGLEVVGWEEKADVYLVNTCSVTERAEKKCRNVIRKVHRISPEARIVVTGCYAELRRAELEAIEGVALVFGAAVSSHGPLNCWANALQRQMSRTSSEHILRRSGPGRS